LTHFTEAIFVASQERVAPQCGTLQACATQLATKIARPSVGQIGPPGSFRRLPDVPASRCAPRPSFALRASWARADRFATMKWVNI
jgi:hypothetical protein